MNVRFFPHVLLVAFMFMLTNLFAIPLYAEERVVQLAIPGYDS
ncbi:MAG: hypothetical protein WCX84_02005 [Syntrophales bacterium]|nr:hypothetical protein [Syntrophales bacterium]